MNRGFERAAFVLTSIGIWCLIGSRTPGRGPVSDSEVLSVNPRGPVVQAPLPDAVPDGYMLCHAHKSGRWRAYALHCPPRSGEHYLFLDANGKVVPNRNATTPPFALSLPVGATAVEPRSRRTVVGPPSELVLYGCANRPGPGGMPVQNAYGTRLGFVLNPANCQAPFVLEDPEKRSAPHSREFLERFAMHIHDWWGGAPVYGDVAPFGGNGIVDSDDIVAVTEALLHGADRPAIDLHPCGGGNGVLDSDDLLAVLGAFRDGGGCP